MTLGLNGVPTWWWCLWNSFHLVVLVLVEGEFLSYLVVVLVAGAAAAKSSKRSNSWPEPVAIA